MTEPVFLENFKTLLLQKDFEATSSDCFIRVENPVLYVVCLKNELPQTQMIDHLQKHLQEFYCQRLICIFISTEDTPLSYTHTNDTYFQVDWHYDIQKQLLTTAPGAPTKILGIEKLLKKAASNDVIPPAPKLEIQTQQKPYITYSIFGICVVLLLFTIISGQKDLLLDRFCISDIGIFVDKEYYRLLTSMFFHTGIMHLTANSIYLLYFGTKAECMLGHKKYLLFYILCGICGSITSVCLSGSPSVGASGAIFGIMGGMLIAVKQYGASYTGMNYATLLLLATSALLMGFLDIGVDNFSHIGGFLSGILLFYAITNTHKK